MSTNTIWGIEPTFIAVVGTLLGVSLGAFLNARAARRRQLFEAKRAAYTKAVASLNLARYYLRIDREYDERIAEVREHGEKSSNDVTAASDSTGHSDAIVERVGDLIADRVDEMKEHRDRILDHVFRPLLEIQSEVRIFGSIGIDKALRQVSVIIEEAVTADGTPLDDEKFDAALLNLRKQIHRELGIRRPAKAEPG